MYSSGGFLIRALIHLVIVICWDRLHLENSQKWSGWVSVTRLYYLCRYTRDRGPKLRKPMLCPVLQALEHKGETMKASSKGSIVVHSLN